MSLGASKIRSDQLERDLFETRTVPDEWPRRGCPVCGKHETLELMAHVEAIWAERAKEACRTVRSWQEFRKAHVQNDHDGYLKKPHERCAGCGLVYDPYFQTRAEILKKNIEALKARALHPLEQLAEESD